MLGMHYRPTRHHAVQLAFSQHQCALEFAPGARHGYAHRPSDFYWKIGITVGNLDCAVRHLQQFDVSISKPEQFRDIGYLCHVTDPNGFRIELLQQGFIGNEQPLPRGHPIASQATLAHLTLRTNSLDKVQHYFTNQLGMRLLSVQPVNDMSFCLYFYSWSNEALPDPALHSVANREWLWRRRYLLVELQHLQSPQASVVVAEKGHSQFSGFSYRDGGGNLAKIQTETLSAYCITS